MTACKRSAAKKARNLRQNFIRLCHATRAIFTAGHLSVVGANHLNPILLQLLQIALRRGMLPHTDIHGGGNHNRGISGQQQG